MKTKPNRSPHKHASHYIQRHHALATRVKADRLIQVAQMPRQREDESVLSPAVEVECLNVGVCSDRMNLLRSTVSDDDGRYLVMSIEVPLPFTAVYDAWIRFGDVPHFMRGTQSPERCDGSRMTWRVRTLFDQFAWQAKVCKQMPYEFIAWKSLQGTPHPGFGSVIFERNDHQGTRIMVQIGFDLSGEFRWLGDPMPCISHLLEQSLKRFYNGLTV